MAMHVTIALKNTVLLYSKCGVLYRIRVDLTTIESMHTPFLCHIFILIIYTNNKIYKNQYKYVWRPQPNSDS